MHPARPPNDPIRRSPHVAPTGFALMAVRRCSLDTARVELPQCEAANGGASVSKPPERPVRRGRQARLAARRRRPDRLGATWRRIPPLDLLTEDELQRVHDASMDILEEVGIEFRDDVALQHWRRAGATVEGHLVRIDRELLMELIALAPAEFPVTGRGPDTAFTMGGDWTVFSPMQGAPFVRDLEGVRRWSTAADLDNLAKLTHSLGAHQLGSGFVCEPMDVAVHHRHLNVNYAHLVYTDLPHFGLTTSREKAEDSVEMARIVYGDDLMRDSVVVFGHCSGNSPLVWDQTMLEGLRAFATAGQGVLLSPFVLGAANTPADVAATVAQLNAETLAAISYAQLVHPGARTIYGQFTVSVSMRTGSPMAGTPEVTLINAIVGQLARRYRLPWRTTGAQASAKSFDAQSGYESATSMMGGIAAGANLMLHTGGWDESGLTNCYGKFVVDAEQNTLIARFASGVSFDRFDEALQAVRRVGPGGHYLGDPFTLEQFREAFSMPELMDFTNYEQWTAAGSWDTAKRARERAKQILAEYERPPIEDAALAELDDFVARRRRDIDGEVR